MYQERSMRVKKVADSPMFCDKTENTSAFMKKDVINKNILRKQGITWYNLNPKGIIIFPCDDKQIILITSVRNNNPES